jgi:hypothetical protein
MITDIGVIYDKVNQDIKSMGAQVYEILASGARIYVSTHHEDRKLYSANIRGSILNTNKVIFVITGLPGVRHAAQPSQLAYWTFELRVDVHRDAPKNKDYSIYLESAPGTLQYII